MLMPCSLSKMPPFNVMFLFGFRILCRRKGIAAITLLAFAPVLYITSLATKMKPVYHVTKSKEEAKVSMLRHFPWLNEQGEHTIKPSLGHSKVGGKGLSKLGASKHDNVNTGKSHDLSLSNEIPRILHRQWTTNRLPRGTRDIVKSWNKHEPKLKNWFWTDQGFTEFITKKLQHFSQIFNYQYDLTYFHGNDSQIWRYFILYEFGGIFTELDMELLKPLDNRTLNYSCVIAQEPFVNAFLMYEEKESNIPFASNELIICKQKHPFMKYLIQKLTTGDMGRARINKRDHFHFHDLAQEYIDKVEIPSNQNKDKIFLAPPDYFMPTFNQHSSDWLKEVCEEILVWKHFPNKRSETRSVLCHEIDQNSYTSSPKAISYTNHHWHDRKVWVAKNGIDVKKVVPGALVVKFPTKKQEKTN